MKKTRLLILGSGPSRTHRGDLCGPRWDLTPLLVHGLQPGGQMTITTDVENYPGFADVIQGPWLMEQMQKQAEHVGTEFVKTISSRMLISPTQALHAEGRQRRNL